MVKLVDLSKELGLSIATISNAFTGKGRMNDETKNHILKKADEIGYKWTPRNRYVAENNILIIVESFTSYFVPQIIRGMSDELKEKNLNCPIYNLNIAKSDERTVDIDFLNNEIDTIVRNFNRPVSGIIFISQYAKRYEGILKNQCCPSVTVFSNREDGKNYIQYDGHQGSLLATKHLISKNRRNIGMISGPMNSLAMHYRSNGFQLALLENGIPYNPDYVRVAEWTLDESFEATKDLLIKHPEIDGIFAQNDLMAFGALKAATQLGFSCPKDIAIIGFDDSDHCKLTEPNLTSIYPEFEKLGKLAISTIEKLINGKKVDSILIPCKLIERESTNFIK